MRTARRVFAEELAWCEPIDVFARLADRPHSLLLESAMAGAPGGRYSFIAVDPYLVLSVPGPRGRRGTTSSEPHQPSHPGGPPTDDKNRSKDRRSGPSTEGMPPHLVDPFKEVEDELARFRLAPEPDLPPFLGGAAGMLGYELGGYLERLPEPRRNEMGFPDLAMGFYDLVIAFDHGSLRSWIVASGLPERGEALRQARALERLLGLREEVRGIPRPAPAKAPETAASGARSTYGGAAPSGSLRGGIPGASWDRSPGSGSPMTVPAPARARVAPGAVGLDGVASNFTLVEYRRAVQRVIDSILAGDIFQANLSQRFTASLAAGDSSLALYRRLRLRNPAPFAAFMNLGERQIVSASPERFLSVRQGMVETRPIKGTRPRGRTAAEDAALAAQLMASDKDRAENVMIVDLLRNDLSRVCRPGSVSVPSLCALESFATVHHLVSTVTGRLRDGATPIDLLRAAFPGGSITGAPKIRAMEVIHGLEPDPRGPYCGSLGYICFDGAMDTNIAIRTLVVAGRRISFHAGGGVVADSDPGAEYDETLDKARALIEALRP